MATAPEYSSEELIRELKKCGDLLVDKLEGDHYDEAVEVINQLVAARDRSVFGAVGNLTRGLHEAIKNVHVEADLSVDPAAIERSDISDASDRLSYVITMTQAAAENTLEKVETAMPVADGLEGQAERLREAWRQSRDSDGVARPDPALQEKVEGFFAQVDGDVAGLRQHFQDILLEQGYQDLTGQVLVRVISLIKAVETDLVELVKIAGQVEYMTGVVESAEQVRAGEGPGGRTSGEGPSMNAAQRDDVVSGQDEVDDLLSQLGF